MTNYSIIIPHKNIPDLLRRCLDSIPRRADVQIIVVDDNSDPEIVNFDCFPGLDEPCVEVYFTKERKGAGYARNVGLEHAIGKWILFADADDLYFSDILNKCDIYKDSKADVIVFKTEYRISDTLEIWPRPFPTVSDAMWNGDMLLFLAAFPMVWSRMYSSAFLKKNNIHFDEVLYFDDTWFTTSVIEHASRIEATKEIIYIHTRRQGSLCTQANKEATWICYGVLKKCNMYLRSIGKPKYEQMLVFLLFSFYEISYWEYVKFLFQAARDNMLNAGKMTRLEYYRISHKITYRYPRLHALYLLLGGYKLRTCVRDTGSQLTRLWAAIKNKKLSIKT